MSAPVSWPTGEDAAAWQRIAAGRRSCRAFTDEVLDQDTLIALLESAQQAASWCNVQPWHVDMVSGAAVARLAESLSEAYDSRVPHWDVEPPVDYRGDHQSRRRGAGAALYAAMGVERDDMAGRVVQMRRNFEFFGAPHVAVISVARDLGPYAFVDVGSYLSGLLWGAEAMGLGTIAQAAPARHSDLLREQLAIPEDHLVLVCVALGHIDTEHPANQFQTERAHLDQVVRWRTT